MSATHSNPVVDGILVDLSAEQRNEFASAPREERLRLLAEFSGLAPPILLSRIARAEDLPIIERPVMARDPLLKLPLRIIHSYQAVPIEPPEEFKDDLCIATLWPPTEDMDRWVYTVCHRHPKWFIAPPDNLRETLTRHFGVGSGSLDDPTADDLLDARENSGDEEDENAAIIRFVNEILAQGVKDRATDIHFEPRKETLLIRYRIDGQLVPVSVPPNLINYQSAIISRIKIMSRLNISEKRRPQDGRITYTSSSRDEVDIRVSTLPTMYGESISMRLLNEQSQPTGIRELGILPVDEKQIQRVIELPHGILLITGPTGSGKSTTLTAFIRRISTPEKRIITVEDPIEYEVPEVNQTQVHPEVGLTFAAALRSVLRQDPDVLMVGEIRDRETADIAIRASLTGHLVLSTLHTNDAPGALTRLVDMDIEPFLIASSVEMIIAQRLIRRLCPKCHAPADMDIVQLSSCLVSLDIDPAEAEHGHLLRKAVGCDSCRNLGFRGRIGMYEILRVNDPIHELIIKRASAREIRERALELGMRTLQSCGWEHVKSSETALPEVMRYAEFADNG